MPDLAKTRVSTGRQAAPHCNNIASLCFHALRLSCLSCANLPCSCLAKVEEGGAFYCIFSYLFSEGEAIVCYRTM